MKRLLWLLVLASCSSETETVVVVSARGLAIPGDIDKVRILITNTMASSPDLPLCAAGATNCLTLPIVATLIPGPDQPSDLVTVQVTAYLRDQPVIADAASFVFQSGQRERLDFVLSRDCLNQLDCAAKTQSCANGHCTTLALTPLGSNPSFDASADDLATPEDLAGVDLTVPAGVDLAGFDLAGVDLPVPPGVDLAHADLRPLVDLNAPDLQRGDLANVGFMGNMCVAAADIPPSASFPAGTCAALCENFGQTCSDDLCVTNRGGATFGVEAWLDAPSCATYATSAGQAKCADDLTSFSSPSVAKYRCCCH